MYCPQCGNEVQQSSSFCPKCGSTMNPNSTAANNFYTASVMVNKKSEGLALILSFFIPGVGQMYVGRIGRGAAILIGFYLSIFIIIAFALVLLLLPILIPFVIWLFGVIDAYRLAKKYNQQLLFNDGQPPW
jgi:TM2 domain-containing membrane protein YozV